MDIYSEIKRGKDFRLFSGVRYDAEKIAEAITFRSDRGRMWVNLGQKHVEDTEKPFSLIVSCRGCNQEFSGNNVPRDVFIKTIQQVFWCKPCQERVFGTPEPKEEVQPKKMFSSFYLNPNEKWENLSVYSFDELVEAYKNTSKQKVEKRIKEMPYGDFLKTPYWIAISYKIKHNAKFKCSMCGGGAGSLQVHHRTYKTHGKEIDNLVDLTCVCRNCHSKHHNK